jgi:two-component sensor histidine kinase
VNVTRQFPRSDRSVRDARAFVVEQLRAQSIDADDVALMVSELATNCIRHAGSHFDVTISSPSSRLVRIAVTDHSGGAGQPQIQNPSLTDPTGRGLQIVSKLSQDWGTSRSRSGGRTVWFTIRTGGERSRVSASASSSQGAGRR